MKEEKLVLGVRDLSKKTLLAVFLFFSFGLNKQQPSIQRAVVTEHNALIYNRPDFDSRQIFKLPRNKIIVISTQIYRPKHLFGSFYRIYINKPQKVRGYISEVDVLPQYVQSKRGLSKNPAYKKRESVLRAVQDQSRIQKAQKKKKTPSSSKDAAKTPLPAPTQLSQKTEIQPSSEKSPLKKTNKRKEK